MRPLLKAALRAPQLVYRRGWGHLYGHRLLLLTHRGRRTGRVHHTVLEVVRYDPATREATVMSGWGPRADWLQNVLAGGEAQVSIGRDWFVADVRLLAPDEAIAALRYYERRHPLLRPIVHPMLSRLAGWHFDGSPQARRRLAQDLPMVAFRPR